MAADLTRVDRTKMGATEPYFATITQENKGAFPTYDEPEAFSELVAVTETLEFAEGSFFSNNRRSENARVFKSGTLAYANKGLSHYVISKIYGSKLSQEGELTYGANDKAPRIGFGFYREMEDDGIPYFEGVYYPSVKASLEGETDNTRGDNITYAGDTTTMAIFALDDEDATWKMTEVFAAAEEAKAWVLKKLGKTT